MNFNLEDIKPGFMSESDFNVTLVLSKTDGIERYINIFYINKGDCLVFYAEPNKPSGFLKIDYSWFSTFYLNHRRITK